MHLIGISYAKNVFQEGSRERARMVRYANAVESYTLVIFSHAKFEYRKVEEGNFTAIPTNSKSRFHMPFDAYRIGLCILKAQKDKEFVVSSQDPFETSLVGLLLRSSWNVLHHIQVHGDFFGTHHWRNESPLNWIRYYFGVWIVRRARCIRVVSERIRRSLIARGVDPKRIAVLPIRTDIDSFFGYEIKKRGLPGDIITILAVGRLSREKNLPMLIDAVVRLVVHHPNVELRIVGSGAEEENLRQHTKRKGVEKYVVFVPWTEDIVAEMQRADIYALTSNYEGYALVLIEAMASGLPIVATDVGCVGEAMKDGVHGHVVPIGSAEACFQALASLIEHPEERSLFGQNGQETARTLAAETEEEYVGKWVDSFTCTSKEL